MQCETYNENLDSKLNLTPRERLENRGKIVIEWLDNTYEDDLGTYLSSGARVWLDDELILDRSPSETSDYTREEVIHDLLVKLGYEVRYIEKETDFN